MEQNIFSNKYFTDCFYNVLNLFVVCFKRQCDWSLMFLFCIQWVTVWHHITSG